MFRLKFRQSCILFILLFVSIFTASNDAHAYFLCPQIEWIKKCFSQSQEASRKYFKEIAEQGYGRIYKKPIKLDLDPLARKWLGTLVEVRASTTPWYFRLGTDAKQWLPRKITRAFYGTAYDFMPIHRLTESAEHFLIPGFQATMPVRIVGGFVLYPLSGYGLTTWYLDKKQKEKMLRSLDEDIDTDYRLETVKNKMLHSKLPKEQARAEAREDAKKVRDLYTYYSAVLDGLKKEGINYDAPEATQLILTDPKIAPKLAPLFKDVYDLAKKQSNFGARSDFYMPKGFHPTFEQIHQITVYNHLKIMSEDQIERTVRSEKGADPQFSQKLFTDPFVKKLVDLRAAGKLSDGDVEYWAINDLNWKTRFLEWKTLDVYPKRFEGEKMTDDLLTLADVQAEEWKEVEKIAPPPKPSLMKKVLGGAAQKLGL